MKDKFFDLRDSLTQKLEMLKTDHNSDRVEEIKRDIENLHRDFSTETRILNSQIEKNERQILLVSRALSDLRSYVVGAVETDRRGGKTRGALFSGAKERARPLLDFFNSHGAFIAYTFLLSGLTALITYYFLTRAV